MYKIDKDWLTPAEKITLPKGIAPKVSEGKNTCQYLIYHYTASTTASSAHNSFMNPDTKASWHITIDRDGKVYQLYDFRKIAWHAGKSGWTQPNGAKLEGLNPCSIGIEMVNAGPLNQKNGSYYTWSGQAIPDMHVGFDGNGNPWQAYTQQQITMAANVGLMIARHYQVSDILGHEHISPGRKQDPGPLFASTLQAVKKAYFTARH